MGVRGSQDYSQAAIVGAFSPRAPFYEIATGVAIRTTGETLRRIDVIAQTADQVPGVLRAVLSIVARDNPNELRIQSPLNLAAIQEEILGDMDRDGHASVLINVMSGGGLVALVVFSDVLIRRRDLGRRRALGMPRWALALLLVLRTAIGASIGALLGSVVAIAMMVSGNEPVELEFVLATALLGIIVASVATIPPAVAAANQDPVRVLRTP